MNIQRIYPQISLSITNQESKGKEKTSRINTSRNMYNPFELRSQFNDHLINFTSRVDKGLSRFFDVNKDRMPVTVFNEINSLEDKEELTPLEAQYLAYSNLEDSKTVEDIKKAYPDEPLFKNLIDPSESKATRGILKFVNETDNKEFLELSNSGVLNNKENLTVYLVKKIFLEAKSLDEINKDLDNDLNSDIKDGYKFKNPGSPYVRSSTLKALGIQLPDSEYSTSLRYTKAGYSDYIGTLISKGLKDFMSSLTPEQRTQRNRMSVAKFEKWWNSYTREEKMDLIADKEYQLEMLKAYKKNVRAAKKAGMQTDILPNDDGNIKEKNHSHVKSEKLSQDELFKMWATCNLKIFEESLSEAEKDSLHLKRMVRLFNRWKDMSPDERTEYISKMKSGLEPSRYAMIEAWNNSQDIIKDLSVHLKENQIYKPAELLYSSEEFSKFQSKVMSEFWQTHPEYALKLGENIRFAQEKVQNAIENGTFEEFKNRVNRDRKYRIKSIETYFKNLAAQEAIPVGISTADNLSDYKQEFRDAYSSHEFGRVKSVPKNYFDDLYGKMLEQMPENLVKIWIKDLKGEGISREEAAKVQTYLDNQETSVSETPRVMRAFEAAMADALYSATKNPNVYGMSNSDVKFAMYHVERGEAPISVYSPRNGKSYDLNIVNKFKTSDAVRLNSLYEGYKRSVPDREIKDIVKYYFYVNITPEMKQKMSEDELYQTINHTAEILEQYIASYGKSINIVFSDKSAYPPEVKAVFTHKFLANMPDELQKSPILRTYLEEDPDFSRETKILKAKYLFGKRFSFLPEECLNSYFKEYGLQFRSKEFTEFTVDEFIDRVCKKRKMASDRATVAVFPKRVITTPEIKYEMLAIEQAMADALYEATGSEDVYKLGFEILCDKVELFSLNKKFPMADPGCKAVDGRDVHLELKKRINLNSIARKYQEYKKEIQEWQAEENNSSHPDYQQLLYILNPEENNPARDINVGFRMSSYFDDMDKITLVPGE